MSLPLASLALPPLSVCSLFSQTLSVALSTAEQAERRARYFFLRFFRRAAVTSGLETVLPHRRRLATTTTSTHSHIAKTVSDTTTATTFTTGTLATLR